MSVKGKVRPVPLEQFSVVRKPFSRVAVDIVYLFSASTSEGHRHILIVIDFSAGMPEAVRLKKLISKVAAEALPEIFSS